MRINKRALYIILPVFLLVTMLCGQALLATGSNNGEHCTIATLSDGKNAYFASNEDHYEFLSGRIKFVPAIDGRHGYALIGSRIMNIADSYFAGSNDQGLVFDMNAMPMPKAKLRQGSGNAAVPGSFFIEVLQTCATVKDVEEWAKGKDLLLMTTQQSHWADRNGDAIVLSIDTNGDLHVTHKDGNYLVSVNYNMALGENAPGRARDWRYNAAVETIEKSDKSLADTAVAVLDACKKTLESLQAHGDLPNKPAANIFEVTKPALTTYSYVADLHTGNTDFYLQHDFNHKFTLNMISEISKGAHEYDMAQQLSQQSGNIVDIAGIILAVLALILAVVLAVIFAMKEKSPPGNKIATVLTGAFIFAVFGFFIRIPAQILTIPDLPHTILYINFIAAAAFTTAILLKPKEALLIIFTGIIIGEVAFCQLFGSADGLFFPLAYTLVCYGAGAIVVSLLRNKCQWQSLTLGLVTMVILALPFIYYYYTFVVWTAYKLNFVITLLAMDLLSVLVSIILIWAVRLIQKQLRKPANA